MAHGQLEGLPLRWSADSRWLTWARGVDDDRRTPRSSSTTRSAAKLHQATSGYFADAEPVFDPDGKYLYFLSNRAFEPVYSDFDNSWTYPNATRARRGGAAPRRAVAARAENDAEGDEGRQGREEKDEAREGRGQPTQRPTAKKDDADDEGQGRRRQEGQAPKPVDDRRSTASRRASSSLPPKPGNYGGLQAASGKLLYRRCAAHRIGRREEPARLLRSRGARGEDGARRAPTASSSRPTARSCSSSTSDKKFGIVEVKADAEDRQADADAPSSRRRSTRRPNGSRCSPTRTASSATSSTTRTCTASTGRRCASATQTLIDAAVTRWDVNFVLGEFIGELNASHTYHGGGDAGDRADARRRHARRRLGARERRLSHQAHRAAAPPGTPTRARRCASRA